MALLISDAEVRQLTNMPAMIAALEEAITEEARGAAVVPPRMTLASGDRFLRAMPVILPGSGVMGLKTIHGGPSAGSRYVILLYDFESGEVLALIDGQYLTAARTGATAAVAAKRLARPESTTAAV